MFVSGVGGEVWNHNQILTDDEGILHGILKFSSRTKIYSTLRERMIKVN